MKNRPSTVTAYRQWRTQVEAIGGCAAPVHLTGSSTILDRDGSIVHQRSGEILAPCGNRRAAVCPACSDRYAADAFHLIRAGLAGDDTKNVPATVTRKPRAFLTLTAPSFGPVHTRALSRWARVIPCGCGERHHPADPRLSTPLDPDTYDYVGAVLWQAHAGQLWARFTTCLRRALAVELGVRVRDFAEVARLSYAKVAEYQARGMVHFHAVIRIDGPEGPADPTPAGLDTIALRRAVRVAARGAVLTTVRPDGTPLVIEWGTQMDLRTITPDTGRELENENGEITDAALAGYIAKYATKGTGAAPADDGTGGIDRPVRDIDHVTDRTDISPHHRSLIRTCWELGDNPIYAELGLRRWAHMLGFRGHFLSKSRRYSTTFRELRGDRRRWRLATTLAEIDQATHDPDAGSHDVDPDDFIVINDWEFVRIGHDTHDQRDQAIAIAERNRERRRTDRATTNAGRTA